MTFMLFRFNFIYIQLPQQGCITIDDVIGFRVDDINKAVQLVQDGCIHIKIGALPLKL